MERDFTLAQEDELMDYTKQSPQAPALLWWDKDDEKTWVPYGWQIKDPKGWIDYANAATKAENGLVPTIPWDPQNPESWIPYGWK
eukprot:4151020-Pyramimonas_sp.AAC.1